MRRVEFTQPLHLLGTQHGSQFGLRGRADLIALFTVAWCSERIYSCCSSIIALTGALRIAWLQQRDCDDATHPESRFDHRAARSVDPVLAHLYADRISLN